MNIFEQASRDRLRFATPKGALSVEDLWTLPLTSTDPKHVTLNSIAIDLHNAITKAPEDIDFVNGGTKKVDTSGNDLRFIIVKHVIKVLVAERDAREAEAVANAVKEAKRKQIIAALGEKDNDDIRSSSREDLLKMLNDL